MKRLLLITVILTLILNVTGGALNTQANTKIEPLSFLPGIIITLSDDEECFKNEILRHIGIAKTITEGEPWYSSYVAYLKGIDKFYYPTIEFDEIELKSVYRDVFLFKYFYYSEDAPYSITIFIEQSGISVRPYKPLNRIRSQLTDEHFSYTSHYDPSVEMVNHGIYAQVGDTGFVISVYAKNGTDLPIELSSYDGLRELCTQLMETSELIVMCDCNFCVLGAPLRYGHILGNPDIKVSDALEILKYIVGMNNVIEECAVAFDAALIVSEEKPGVSDALEILKEIVGMPNKISG